MAGKVDEDRGAWKNDTSRDTCEDNRCNDSQGLPLHYSHLISLQEKDSGRRKQYRAPVENLEQHPCYESAHEVDEAVCDQEIHGLEDLEKQFDDLQQRARVADSLRCNEKSPSDFE